MVLHGVQFLSMPSVTFGVLQVYYFQNNPNPTFKGLNLYQVLLAGAAILFQLFLRIPPLCKTLLIDKDPINFIEGHSLCFIFHDSSNNTT